MNTILVTGGAGFIGSAFVRFELSHYLDTKIVVLDKLTYSGNLDNLREADPTRYSFLRGDVNDADIVHTAMQGCDAVVHFAAESHVDRSLSEASSFVDTNVGGVNTLLEVAMGVGVQRIVLVSTDEVYGSIESGSFRETDPIHPRNPYAASKAAGELFGLAYYASYGLPVLITRGSNTYGPYQHLEKALPLFITSAIDREPLPLYGDGNNIRDWLFVDDHCRAIDCVLRTGMLGEIYNIAGRNEKKNIECIQKILSLLNVSESLICAVRDRKGHDRRYSIDDTKIRNLGWEPRMDWESGIAYTVRWYQTNEWWWRKIKSGPFQQYYKEVYGPLIANRKETRISESP